MPLLLDRGWRKPDNVAGSSAPAIMIGLFVATGGVLFGYDTGTVSGILAMRAFRRQFSTGYVDGNDHLPNITPTQSAQVVSMLSAGTFFGSLMAAPLGDRLGRRLSLIISVAIFTLGVLLQMCAMDLPLLIAGRFFAGLGVGTISVLVPLYQSEMAPKWIRGALVCAYQLAITFGILIASVVNIGTQSIDGVNAFRIPIAMQFVWAGGLLLGLSFLPETPRYLIKRNMRAEAALSLSRLRRLDITHPALLEELAEIEANHQYELSLGPSTYKEIFVGSPHLGRRVLTACGLQMLQQLSGCNFVLYYGTTFFQNIGVTSPFVIQLVINLVNFFSTLPGMVLVEVLGRRRLLMLGAAGMCVSQLIIASVGTALPMAQVARVVLIVFVCIDLFFFAASWGPVVWVVTSEIHPLKVRAKAMSVSVASNWILNFAIAYGTPYLVNRGEGYVDLAAKIFFVWGACCALAVVFVWFMVYETSKMSLEQIDEMYERVDRAWKSPSFEPSWSFQEMRDDGASSSAIQLAEPHPSEEARRRAGTTASATESSTASSSTMTEEDKIVAQLGHIDLSY